MDTPLSIVNLSQTDNDATYNIGDLRRGYAYGSDRLSRLMLSTDTLFRVLAAQKNDSVAETIWKIPEERDFTYKRYGYVVGWKAWSGTGTVPTATAEYTCNSNDISSLTPQTKGSFMALKIGTDYLSSGLVGNIFGQATNKIAIGDSGTCPNFLLVNQVIKVCTKSAADGVTLDDYFEGKILSVGTSGQYAYVGIEVTRAIKTATNKYLCSFTDATTPISDTYTYSPGILTNSGTQATLESMRTYVVGNVYKRGSGLPGWYNHKPFYTRYGMTTIVKHAIGIDGSTAATELKIEKNEFLRLWLKTILLHKWDIANRIYFSALGADSDGAQHTQGIVDFAINYGNIFSLSTSKTQDDFLDDMTILTDPRVNNIRDYLFVCQTYWGNWFMKLGGYLYQNMMIGNATDNRGAVYGVQFTGTRSIGGAAVHQFTSPAMNGTINIMVDPHLDGTPIKILGVPMNNILYRPLVGNARNRDTTIYPGVIKIETSGVDAIVNLIQTEFGIQVTLPETWAAWL